MHSNKPLFNSRKCRLWIQHQEGRHLASLNLDEVYFQRTTSIPPASNSRLSSLPPKPTGFSYEREATINIPLDIASRGSRNQDLKKKEKELQSKEADLRRREQEVRRKEEAVARAGVVLEEKNWPPFFLSFIMILLMKF
ncbi:hypothetical protein V6Z11_D02G113700 [Gossypium hirsutum]